MATTKRVGLGDVADLIADVGFSDDLYRVNAVFVAKIWDNKRTE